MWQHSSVWHCTLASHRKGYRPISGNNRCASYSSDSSTKNRNGVRMIHQDILCWRERCIHTPGKFCFVQWRGPVHNPNKFNPQTHCSSSTAPYIWKCFVHQLTSIITYPSSSPYRSFFGHVPQVGFAKSAGSKQVPSLDKATYKETTRYLAEL